jgi:tetratricopeptide (TPR) repeat protein
MTLPIAVVANLWKGTIARHSGDFEAARAAYASVMAKAEKFPREKPFLQMMSAIYLAEIEAASSRREDMMKQLEAAKAVERPKDMPEVHTFYTDWARFQVMVAKDGPDSVQEALKGDEKRLRALSFVPFYHFLLTGIGTEPGTGLFDDNRLYMRALELAAENRTSPIDRSLAFLLLGGCADRRKELDRAASAYRRLFESDSFLAPDSGILLLRLLKRQGKEDEATAVKEAIEKRFPGYKELADKPVGTR